MLTILAWIMFVIGILPSLLFTGAILMDIWEGNVNVRYIKKHGVELFLIALVYASGFYLFGVM